MPSPQYQRNQASLRALKHQCLFDFDFRRELPSRMRISHKALKMKSSSLLTDGALAKWEASLKLGPGLRAHFGIQESELQEFRS